MVVLGISLGTRTTGIAIVHDKELLECRTLTVRSNKGTAHTDAIDHYIKQYHILVVVIKIPPITHITEQLSILVKRVTKLFEYHGCVVDYKDSDAIKAAVPEITNKEQLISFATIHYPALIPLQEKEAANKNKYHEKMFEAVVIAHLHVQSTMHKNSP